MTTNPEPEPEPTRNSTLRQRLAELRVLIIVILLLSVPFAFYAASVFDALTRGNSETEVIRRAVVRKFSTRAVESSRETKRTLHFLVWDGYFDPYLLNTFEEIFGIRVVTHKIEGNDLMEAELKGPRDQWRAPYDLILPAQYQVPILSDLGIISAIGAFDIEGREDLRYWIIDEPELDRVQEFSVPYFMGSVGLAFQRDRENLLPIDWEAMFGSSEESRVVRSLRNRTIIMEDMRFSLGSALIYLDADPNTREPDKVKQAADLLIGLIRNRGAFLETEYTPEYLAQRSVDVAMSYSADPVRAFDVNPGIGFTNPLPGTILWIDCLAIVEGCENPEGAARFIEFVLDPRVAGYVTSMSKYATTLSPIKTDITQYIADEVRNGFSYAFPDFSSRHLLQALDPATREVYDKEWNRVREAARQYSHKPPLDPTPAQSSR